jgi:glutathione S-transferase
MDSKYGQIEVIYMKLYTFEVAPNPRRLGLFMAYKGIAMDTIHVDMGSNEQLGEAYLAINPEGTVPTLMLDDGTILTDVVACCVYLESLYPDQPLLGASALERAQILGWMHKVFCQGVMAVAEILRNQSEHFKHRALPGTRDLEQIPELVERGKLRLGDFFTMLERHLQDRDYLVGAQLSQADIDALVACDFASWVKASIPASCPRLQAWHERIKMELN